MLSTLPKDAYAEREIHKTDAMQQRVLQWRQLRQQFKILKHEADVPAPPRVARAFPHGENVAVAPENRAGAGRQQAGPEVPIAC